MLVHVLAAGPSISSYQSVGWPAGIIIGVNGTGLLCSALTAWCAIDPMPQPVVEWAARWQGQQFCAFENHYQFPNAVPLKHWCSSAGPLCIEDVPKHGFYWHGSSAMLAAEIARTYYQTETVIVHGLDYNSNQHAYDHLDPSLKRKDSKWNMPLLEDRWKCIKINYNAMGIRIFNANKKSALQALPFCDGKTEYLTKLQRTRAI